MKLDIDAWEWFKLGGKEGLFEIKKGKRLTAEEQVKAGKGKTPYIGAIDSNNGVSNQISQDPIHKGNTISLSYNGSVGEAFYQPKDYWATDDVNALYLRARYGKLTPATGLFICAVLKHEKCRFSYGRKWTLDNMNNTWIKLPAKDGQPDWQWIQQYMETLHFKPLSTANDAKKDERIDVSDWKPFLLCKLFDACMGNGIDAIKTKTCHPEYNYVSRDSNGNGVVAKIDEVPGAKAFLAGDMTLSLGGSYLGSCFVQSAPFYTAQNVAVLRSRKNISTETKLFIATLIRLEASTKFQAFGRELNTHYKKDFTIKLPIKKTEDGHPIIDAEHRFSDDGYIPDWEYMDSYVRQLPYGDRIPGSM